MLLKNASRVVNISPKRVLVCICNYMYLCVSACRVKRELAGVTEVADVGWNSGWLRGVGGPTLGGWGVGGSRDLCGTAANSKINSIDSSPAPVSPKCGGRNIEILLQKI